jgi:hypothetical protein
MGWLFLGPHGRPGRLVEGLHLKLRLLADAIAEARSAVSQQRRPILSLTADSFQIRLGDAARELPFLWTARAVLADAGDAVELTIEGSDTRCYLRGRSAGMSIYHPASAVATGGRATVRIRQSISDGRGASVVEGTFATQERLDVTPNDLVWLRLNVADAGAASGRVDLYAHLERQSALAAGEWRFRTVSRRFSPQTVTALKAAEGVPIPGVLFDVVPLLSSPCDLYSLGVLGVRTLLVNNDTSLPVALDETFSLARQVAAGHDASAPLGERIRRLFQEDARWAASLGPHRLSQEKLEPAEAFDLVPAELWCDVLAMLIGTFPGLGPDSQCADFGDAPPGGLHRVFDRAAGELDKLLVRTRSLIVIDWRFNRQVHAVIRERLVGLTREREGG